MFCKTIKCLLLIGLVVSNTYANTVTITTNRSISYLQSNNVGGSGAGGTLGSADNIKIGTAGSGSNSTLTLTVDANATINQIVVGDVYGVLFIGLGKINGIISFSGNYTLTVTTDVILGDYTSILGLGSTSASGAINMASGGYLKCRVIGVNSGNPASCVGVFTPGTGTVEITGTFILNTVEYSVFNNLVINSGGNTVVMYETLTTITGNLTFTSGVLDVNNQGCDIDLKGDWTNNVGSSAFVYGSRTVTFSGTGAQSLGGTGSTTFKNVIVNKVSGTLTLNQNETITTGGVLTLTAGPVALNKKTLTISNSATTAITRILGYLISEDNTTTGGKANNESAVTWTIGSTTGAHVFPFANNSGVYIPFTYNLASGSVGNLTISTYASAANNTPMPIGVSQVTDTTMSMADNSTNTVDRFWQVSATSTSGTGSFTFSYADAEAPAAGETGDDNKGLIAQQWNTNGWQYDNDPTVGITWIAYYRNQTANSVSNTVTVNGFASGLSSAKPWTLALHAHPLPVTLNGFCAKPLSNNETILKWSTLQEINCDRFEIERRTNAQWGSIGEVSGAGSTNISTNYEWIDKSTPVGTVYYRLKQVDFDHKYSYSDIIAINNSSLKDSKIMLLQDVNQAVISFYNSSENVANAYINLINELGENVSNINITNQLTNGNNTQTISIEQLPVGFYVIQLVLDENQQTLKFVKS